MADWLGNNSRARKAAGEAVVGAKIDIEKDERFWSESVDGKLTAAMEGAWKARGKDLLTTKEGKDRVRKALADFEGTFAAHLGFDTLDLPQGRFFGDMFHKMNEDLAAQAIASHEVLSRGHGLKPVPKETSKTSIGQPGENGLLPPGSSPEFAIDLDSAETDDMRQACLVRGQVYEGKLDLVDNLCLGTHYNDARLRFYEEARRVLWAFKINGTNKAIWDIAREPVAPQLPYDFPENKCLFPGAIVHSMLPQDIDIAPELLTGLETEGGQAHWLTEEMIESAFLFARPALLPHGTEYLGLGDTPILGSSFQRQLKDNAKDVPEMSIKALLQYKRDHGGKIPANAFQGYTHFRRAPALPASTTRVFFFANPHDDHWVVVSADLYNGATRTGLITVYDSLLRPLSDYQRLFQQYLAVISAFPDSPFADVDWMRAEVMYGVSLAQEFDSSDCGVITMENLMRIALGTETEAQSNETGLDRRHRWLATMADLVETSTGARVRRVRRIGTLKVKGLDSAQTIVDRQLAKFTIKHWQYMIVQAQPGLVNDIDGQRREIRRIYPSILDDDPALTPIEPVAMPDQHVPYAYLGLNNSDDQLAQPRLTRKPDAIWAIARQSREKNRENDSLATIGDIARDWCDTFYNNVDGLDVNLMELVVSSEAPFLGLSLDSSCEFRCKEHLNSQKSRQERGRFVAAMDGLQADARDDHRRRLVVIIQANYDGSTVDCASMSIPGERWPDLDFRLSTFSRRRLHERQPFDSTWAANRTGICSWVHHDMKELAARATAKNFDGLGPHQDSHNQFAFIVGRIRVYKGSGEFVQHRDQWPIEYILTGHKNQRTFQQSALELGLSTGAAPSSDSGNLNPFKKCKHVGDLWAMCLTNPPLCKHACCHRGLTSESYLNKTGRAPKDTSPSKKRKLGTGALVQTRLGPIPLLASTSSAMEPRVRRPSVVLTIDEGGLARAATRSTSPEKDARERYPGLYDDDSSHSSDD
jgi:hypothetical protein